MRGRRPIRAGVAARWVNTHQGLEIVAKWIFMLLNARDEVVAAICKEAAEAHLESRHIARDPVVGGLLVLDSSRKEVVAQFLQRVVDRGIEVRRSLPASH